MYHQHIQSKISFPQSCVLISFVKCEDKEWVYLGHCNLSCDTSFKDRNNIGYNNPKKLQYFHTKKSDQPVCVSKLLHKW